MDIANPALIETPHEQIVMPINELSAESLKRRQSILLNQGSKKRLELGEVFLPLFLNTRRIMKSRASFNLLRTGMERRQNLRHSAHHLRRQLARFEQKGQHASLGQSSHDERIFHRFAPSPEPPTGCIETDGHDR